MLDSPYGLIAASRSLVKFHVTLVCHFTTVNYNACE